MKMPKRSNLSLVLAASLALLVALGACSDIVSFSPKEDVTDEKDDNPVAIEVNEMDDLIVPDGFDWRMASPYTVEISTYNRLGGVATGVFVEIYDFNPYIMVNGVEKFNPERVPALYRGKSNAEGQVTARFMLKNSKQQIFVCPRSAGYTGVYSLSTETAKKSALQIGAKAEHRIGRSVSSSVHMDKKSGSSYLFLGGWDEFGKPDYLIEPDVVSEEYLAVINASLPEAIPLTESHPEYLDDNSSGDLKLVKDAEVWLTFVHEGAGQTNTVGYYTYTIGEEPASVSEITDATIVFPNSSFQNSGGDLLTGDKVQLKYWNEETQSFQNRFPANTGIGWFLLASGWDSENEEISGGYAAFYSNPDFNPEPTDEKRKHSVLLYDAELELVLLGFEDLKRIERADGTLISDEDFNDAIFYVTASPFDAIDDELDDTDDPEDEEPEIVHTTGTLAYEDLWPAKGDYDFNDLVVEYDFVQTIQGNNLLALECKYTLMAIGASYHNGFALELPIPAEAVASVSGSLYQEGYVQTNANGTEAGQQNAVVVFFENSYKVLPYVGGHFVNTWPGAPYSTPEERTITIEFVEPVSLDEIGLPPYNPFLIVNRKGEDNETIYRTAEVHLPNQKPTDLADRSLFGMYQDDSSEADGRFYLTENDLPWALNIPASFDYPFEKVKIIDAYPHFSGWVMSGGEQYADWYEDIAGYRVTENIYTK